MIEIVLEDYYNNYHQYSHQEDVKPDFLLAQVS